MEFKKVSIDDREIIEYYLTLADYPNCELTFTNILLWGRKYPLEYGIVEDHLVLRSDKHHSFTFPLGKGDVKPAFDSIINDCQVNNRLVNFHCVNEAMWEQIKTIYPGCFQIIWERDIADYIYFRKDLAELKGKKYHGKRNHINNFLKSHNWTYEPITERNRTECFALCETWWDLNQEDDSEKELELSIAKMALNLKEELGLVGGLIRVDGEVVAFSLGEAVNHNTFVVHIEKALADVQGAYPMINQQLILHEAMDYEYINREDDTGVPGLRKAKLSYRPAYLLKKGYVTEKKDTKKLYKEIFSEDSDSFVDYYYNNKVIDNKILTKCVNDQVVAMLHMNPYEIMIDGRKHYCYYLVAVATKEEYRHRGYMRELMNQAVAIAEMEETSYIYLMPANPDIYRPFGFEFITEPMRSQVIVEIEEWEHWKDSQSGTLFINAENCEELVPQLLEQMVQFAMHYLQKQYDCYTCPSVSHYEDLFAQAISEDGGLCILYDEKMKIKAFCFYYKGKEVELFEVLGHIPFKKTKEVPEIMVRPISGSAKGLKNKSVHIHELV